VTDAWQCTVPPSPVAVRSKVRLEVMLLTVSEPFSPTAPMPLSIETEVALVLVQVSTLEPPDCTEVGLALSVQTGAGGDTGWTVTDA